MQNLFIKFFITVRIRSFKRNLLIGEQHEVINQNLCSFLQCFLRVNGTIRSNFKHQFLVVSLLFYAIVFNGILDITNRRVNRIDRNHVNISTEFTVFICRNVTTTFVNRKIYLHCGF